MDASAEVEAMARADRKRWLTVAEAQQVRKQWDTFRDGMEKSIEKYDADPEAENESMVLIIMAALMADGFLRKAIEATDKVKELLGEEKDAA